MLDGTARYAHVLFPTSETSAILKIKIINSVKTENIRKNQLRSSIFLSYFAMVRNVDDIFLFRFSYSKLILCYDFFQRVFYKINIGMFQIRRHSFCFISNNFISYNSNFPAVFHHYSCNNFIFLSDF